MQAQVTRGHIVRLGAQVLVALELQAPWRAVLAARHQVQLEVQTQA